MFISKIGAQKKKSMVAMRKLEIVMQADRGVVSFDLNHISHSCPKRVQKYNVKIRT